MVRKHQAQRLRLKQFQKFTSAETVSVSENQTSALILVATDEDKDVLTYSISGTDASAFTVDASTGEVVFNAAPDYDTKKSYTFTANVSDGTNDVTQTVIVNIKKIFANRAELKDKIVRYSNTNTSFADKAILKEEIENADVTAITEMGGLFMSNSTFNLDISGWDTSNVTNMGGMFDGASAFDQDISGWDVSKVTIMSNLFKNASAFNQDISDWDVSKVTDMSYLFCSASTFNQDINGWDVSKVTNMDSLFRGATAFNQDISGWDVSKVTDMSYLFCSSTFNQDISGWDTSSVLNMTYMFYDATAFNQDLSDWRLNVYLLSTGFSNNSNWITKPIF